ncbi:hypothetical protein IV203_035272 [Nitzschia inconspicua]|uniref:Uncharacterized protein n=1 Tax=Nitzschia inconspicua TaxID=303405 RepID=A0A9K3LDQ1_9STRA|nr:hypothetical protein IV203_035272 [Nitzschia inconspicua]
MIRAVSVFLLVLAAASPAVHSLSLPSHNNKPGTNELSRRKMMGGAAVVAFSSLLSGSSPSWAVASSPPTPDELKRIQVGYKQITELLNNFEEATTTCRENGGECKRDAEPIRRVLGLRSTTDPLFQIEKVFDKVKYMDGDIDLETFFQATEDWNSAMTLSNSMAFISQFGEYNPGGGKDEVLKYLNESKKAVVVAQASLKKIMDALGLQELPA